MIPPKSFAELADLLFADQDEPLFRDDDGGWFVVGTSVTTESQSSPLPAHKPSAPDQA